MFSLINFKDPLKFPVDALIQQENNLFTENWSIPYKKDEWLERLLVSTIVLLREGIGEICVDTLFESFFIILFLCFEKI